MTFQALPRIELHLHLDAMDAAFADDSTRSRIREKRLAAYGEQA